MTASALKKVFACAPALSARPVMSSAKPRKTTMLHCSLIWTGRAVSLMMFLRRLRFEFGLRQRSDVVQKEIPAFVDVGAHDRPRLVGVAGDDALKKLLVLSVGD